MKAVPLMLLAVLLAVGVSATAVAQSQSSGEGADIVSEAADKDKSNRSLIPDCLRKAEQVRTVGADCVLDSITFYTNLLLFVVAVASLFYMLYGAFLYSSAFGDESKIALAKKTITYAIVGVILAGVSFMLVKVVETILKA